MVTSDKGGAATGCCVGSDVAAGDDVVGDEGVVGCCAGNGAVMGDGGAGRTAVSIGRGDGACVGGVVISLAGGGITYMCLGRGGSPSSILIHGWNGAHSHMAACWHFWMLWPGCEQKRHQLECDWE